MTHTGLAERADAINNATWSTITASAGLACAAGGAVLYITAKPDSGGVAFAARPLPGGASMLLQGAF